MQSSRVAAPSMVAVLLLAVALPNLSLAARSHAAAHGASIAGARVTPVQKVIQMLNDMLAKGKEEKHTEEVAFSEFQEWCEGVRSEKTKSIKEASEQIVQLSADIIKAKSDAEILAGEISDLEASIGAAEAEAENATAMRKKEHSDFMTLKTDLSESISACARAVQVLKTREADVPQSLMQARAFLEKHLGKAKIAQAPEANAYEFQSGGVVGMLEKLQAKFKEELFAAQKAEISSKSNYEMIIQQLEDNLKADKASVSAKTAAKAGRLEDAASAKGEKAMTEKAKAEDEKTLADTNTECHAKSEEFEGNQVVRAGEVKAIEKAVEILSGKSVSGHAETYLPGAALLQAKERRASFAQAHSITHGDADARRRAVAYLQARSAKLGSKYLSVMAVHASDDPFAKVKKMIKSMITKLMEEANEEADQHAYCTSELAMNKQTREDKTEEVDKLTAEVEKLTAEEAQLAGEIQELSDAMAEIQGQQSQATKLRQEEKAANAKAVADAKEGQLAVQQAIEVLRAFYAQAAEGGVSALIQSGARGKAASGRRAAAPYTGMQDETTGVMGMLEVILSDFARLESSTSADEDQAASAHETFMAESTEDLAVKRAETEHKENKKQRTQDLLRSAKKELGLTQQELTQAQDYYAKLKADCLDEGLSYEERKSMREEEIQSLKEAMRILSGEDLA